MYDDSSNQRTTTTRSPTTTPTTTTSTTTTTTTTTTTERPTTTTTRSTTTSTTTTTPRPTTTTTVPPKQTTTTTPASSVNMDVMFLLDTSAGSSDSLRGLISRAVDILSSQHRIRYGLVTFASLAARQLVSTSDVRLFKDSVQNALTREGVANYYGALWVARYRAFQSGQSNRKVAVLITDSKHTRDIARQSVINAAIKVQKEGLSEIC